MSGLPNVGAAAILGIAASLAAALWTRADPAAGPNAELEAQVLMQTIDAHERRLEVDPRNPIVAAALVRHHMVAFQLDNELTHLERATTLAEGLLPTALDRAAAHARVAAARLSLHDFRGALDAARNAVAGDSSDEAALGTLFDATTAAGAYDEAERALTALRKAHPRTLATHLRHARWLEAKGTAGEAFTRLEPACRRLRARAVRRQLVAWCETILGGFDGAAGDLEREAAWYRQALATQPGYLPAIEGLAGIAYRRSEWERAATLYRTILTDAHPDLHLRLAEVMRAMGDERAADAHEQRFVRLVSTSRARALHAHELALFLSSHPERRDEALEVIMRDVAVRRSVEALEVLAWVHLARGELRQALGASAAARSRGAPDATSDYTLARILCASGRAEEARPLLERALANPSDLAPHARWDATRRTPVRCAPRVA
ncbi:MAG: tetratricopeptide repeat protein [Longimicrobiales bacterium]